MICRDKNLRLEILRLRYNEQNMISSNDQTLNYRENSAQPEERIDKPQIKSDQENNLHKTFIA